MRDDDPQLKKQYRMPRVFGSLPGPRNVPVDKQHLLSNQTSVSLAVTALSERHALTELLPQGCELAGEALFSVAFSWLSNIGWLAGHGYNMVTVSIPMQYRSTSRGLLYGDFMPVIWEDLADPIITGREELGWAKIYAEIPQPVTVGNEWCAAALWKGFRFLELEASDLVEAVDPAPDPTGQFHFKYVPRTGDLGRADVEYLSYAPAGEPAAGYRMPAPSSRRTGSGSFAFRKARWEDVPFQYPIINALASIPLREFRGAVLSRREITGVVGNPAAGTLIPLD